MPIDHQRILSLVEYPDQSSAIGNRSAVPPTIYVLPNEVLLLSNAWHIHPNTIA